MIIATELTGTYDAHTLAISLVLTTMLVTISRADLDTSERAELNRVIEDFIRNNPEVVRYAGWVGCP